MNFDLASCSMTEELDKKFEAVSDRDSFLEFVTALIMDREDEVARDKENPSSPYIIGNNGWEHSTIEAYLDACVAWARDCRRAAWELAAEPSWKGFAEFLYRGKSYE